MTVTMFERTRDERRQAGAAGSGGPLPTLADEHALLLGQVAVRVEDLLAGTAEDRWPGRELQALLGYLRTEVLAQAAGEEGLLFPAHDPPPGFARLSRDHVRLRAGTEVLARVAAGEGTRSPAQLAVTARDLLTQLECHLIAEEKLLAATCAPDTAARHAAPREGVGHLPRTRTGKGSQP